MSEIEEKERPSQKEQRLGSKHKHWGGVRRKKNFIGDTKFWFVEHFLLKSLFLNLGLVSLSPMDSMFVHLPNLT